MERQNSTLKEEIKMMKGRLAKFSVEEAKSEGKIISYDGFIVSKVTLLSSRWGSGKQGRSQGGPGVPVTPPFASLF